MSSRVVTPAVPPMEASSTSAPPSESSAIRHVRQRTARDCGVAAAAMLAAVSYERAAHAHPLERQGRGLQAMDIAIMLRRLTGRFVRLSGAAEGRTLAEYAAAAAPAAIVLIHEPGSVRGHYVVVAAGLILDPELAEPAPVALYPHRDWRVFRVLTLEDAPAASAA